MRNSAISIVLSYIYSSAPSLHCKVRLLDYCIAVGHQLPEMEPLKKIQKIYLMSGDLPSFDYVRSLDGLDLNLQELSDTVHLPDLMSEVDNYIAAEARREASLEMLNVSKNMDTLDVQSIQQSLERVQSLITRKKDRQKRTPEQYYNYMKSLPAGILTYIEQMDDAIMGAKKGAMSCIAAFPGGYKTTTGISILYGNAVNLSQNGVFISLEMSKNLLWYYVLSRHSYSPEMAAIRDPIDKSKLIHGTLTKEEEEHLFGVVQEDLTAAGRGRIEILDKTDFNDLAFQDIKSTLRGLDFPIDFCIWDYVQCFMHAPAARQMGKNASNAYVAFINEMSLDLFGVPTSQLILAQTNREGYDNAVRNNGKYDLTALAELNQIEKDCAYIMFLYNDANLAEAKELKVCMPKNRFGAVILDPVITNVDPRYAVVGNAIKGFMATTDLGSNDLTQDLFGGSSGNLIF